MPTQSSMRMHNPTQPVGHTGPTTANTAPRAPTHPHHSVQGATHEPVREESQIVGSTSAGAHVVMVTTDPQGRNGAGGMQSGERTANGFRQLKVEDALLYLEQVKSQFTEHPAVYNQFLDIMKEFKAQSINTSQVIRRVSQLFQGHKGLILGFNTFLPPGYKIELRDGGMTAGYSAPGEAFSALPTASTQPQPAQSLGQQPPPQPQQTMPATVGIMQQHTANSHPAQPRTAHGAPQYAQHQSHHAAIPHHVQHPQGRLPGPGRTQPDALHRQPMHGSTAPLGQHGSPMPLPPVPRAPSGPGDIQQGQRHLPLPTDVKPTMAADGAATLAGGFGATGGPAPTEAGKPIEFDQAVSYVNKIKSRFSEDEAVYKRFLDILQTYQKEQRTIKQVYKQVSELFRDHPDLLNEFSHFLPEAQSVANAQAQQLAAHSAYMAGTSLKQSDGRDSGEFMPAHAKTGNMAIPIMTGGTGNFRSRPIKREGRLVGVGGLSGPSMKKTITSSDAGKKMRRSYKKLDDGYEQAPTVEMEFFDEVRNQLGENGAAVYKELIKCLSLVSQEIICAEELLKLIDGLLVNHKHLTNAFRVFINHTDPNAAERALHMLRNTRDPELTSKRPRDEQRLNPIYRDKKLSDVVREYGDSVPGSSYAKYPEDLGGVQCSGMTDDDRQVLNSTVGIAKRGPRLLDHDTLNTTPERRISLQQVLQEGRRLRGPRVSDVSDSGPRSPTAVLDDGVKGPQLTVEEQRIELDVLIGTCDSTLKKLEQIMAGDKSTDELTAHDFGPIELIYEDSFKEFEHLLRNSNEQAVRTIHTRLKDSRKEWSEARKRMEQVWRTHRFGGGGKTRKYTRTEFVEEIRNVESRKEKLFSGVDCNEIVEELLWYMLEWNLNDEDFEQAEHIFNEFDRLRNVVRQTEGWFIVEVHLYVLLRLLFDVTERAQWIVEQGKVKETVDALKGLLSNEMDIVMYEAKLDKLYDTKEWQEKLSDFGLTLKRFVTAFMKFPGRGLAQTMLSQAERRVMRKNEMETGEDDKKYVKQAMKMAEAKGCEMVLKIICSTQTNDEAVCCTNVEIKHVVKNEKEKMMDMMAEPKKSNNKFVNYVERLARKRKRMQFDNSDHRRRKRMNSEHRTTIAQKA